MRNDLEETLASFTPADRAEIERKGRRIADHDRALADLREIRRMSQQQLAERLGVEQSAVSKIERRSDLYMSIVRKYVEAVGGKLEIVARFPDLPPVRLKQFGSLGDRSSSTDRVEA